LPPKATELARRNKTPLCAKSDLTHCSKRHRYSITSSASASSVGGTLMPSAFAVWSLRPHAPSNGARRSVVAGRAPQLWPSGQKNKTAHAPANVDPWITKP